MSQTIEGADKIARVRELNDRLRATCVGGAIVCTQGVAAMPEETRRRVMAAVRSFEAFDAFDADNDPHGEHDFGSIEIDGEKLFFKIDYFDKAVETHSPDAADPQVTTRILTIMRADEY